MKTLLGVFLGALVIYLVRDFWIEHKKRRATAAVFHETPPDMYDYEGLCDLPTTKGDW